MTLYEGLYFGIALSGLGVFCWIIHIMGQALTSCPDTGRAARAGSLVIMTGFAAIGFGVVALIAAFLPRLTLDGAANLYVTPGLAAVALGIGRTMAADQLRQVVSAAADRIAAAKAQRGG